MTRNRPGLFPRYALAVAAAGLAGMLAGCASTPAAQSNLGDPRPLMALVASGQISPNADLPLDSDGSVTITPLCALIPYLVDAPHINSASTVELLLSRGADVNKPCKTRPVDSAYNRAMAAADGLPLDQVRDHAIHYGALPNELERLNGSTRYRPHYLPTLFAFAEKLIQRGAKSKTGPMSLAQLKSDVNRVIVGAAKFDAEREEEQREKERKDKENSLFNASTLKGVATIAGMAAGNYAAAAHQRRIQEANATLPLAKVTPFPPAGASNSPPPAANRYGQPAARSTQPVIGAENAKAGAPTITTDRSHLGSATANMTDNDLAQLGARAAGISLDNLDRKPATAPSAVPSSAAPHKDASPGKQEGCYIPKRNPALCLVVESAKRDKGEVAVIYRNHCEARVYGEFCNVRNDGTADCGAHGIGPGEARTWRTQDAAGAYAYKFTGSKNAEFDWVCSDKDHDPAYHAHDLRRQLGAR